MKQLVALLSALLLTFTSYSSTLNLDYNSIKEEIKSCRNSSLGCTTEQEIEIAKFNGDILNAYDLNSYLAQDSQKSIFIPLELTNGELLTLAVATSLGVVAFNNDQEIMDTVQRNKTEVTEKVATVGNFLGGNAVVPIAAGSYFIGVYFQNNKLKKVGLFMVGASLAHSIVTTAVKIGFGRVRPKENLGPYEFFKAGNKSFYSGHTAEAFTLATVISEMYKDDYPVVPWIAYGLASIGAYARIHDKAHWASDVIVGAVTGHLITKLAMNAMNDNNEGRGGLLVYPGYDNNNGVTMLYAEWTQKEKSIPLKCSQLPEGAARMEACIAEVFARSAKN